MRPISKGSPPHTRGKALYIHPCDSSSGITPAYAGKGAVQGGDLLRCRDHPRIRGERFIQIHPAFLLEGSPPHTRGKVDIGAVKDFAVGITPAYAGKGG